MKAWPSICEEKKNGWCMYESKSSLAWARYFKRAESVMAISGSSFSRGRSVTLMLANDSGEVQKMRMRRFHIPLSAMQSVWI